MRLGQGQKANNIKYSKTKLSCSGLPVIWHSASKWHGLILQHCQAHTGQLTAASLVTDCRKPPSTSGSALLPSHRKEPVFAKKLKPLKKKTQPQDTTRHANWLPTNYDLSKYSYMLKQVFHSTLEIYEYTVTEAAKNTRCTLKLTAKSAANTSHNNQT